MSSETISLIILILSVSYLVGFSIYYGTIWLWLYINESEDES